MNQIVVGVEGSTASAASLNFATQLAVGGRGEILADHAFEPPHTEAPPVDHDRRIQERSPMLSGSWVRTALDAGVSVTPIARDMHPADDLLAVAAASNNVARRTRTSVRGRVDARGHGERCD